MGKMDGLCIINSLYPFFTHFAQDRKERVGFIAGKNGKLLGRLKNEEVRRGA